MTSQILTDLVNTRSLLVSTLSKGQLLCLRNGQWGFKNINSDLGMSVNNGKVAITGSNNIRIYDENSGSFIKTILTNEIDIHQIFIKNDETALITAPIKSSILWYSDDFSSSAAWSLRGYVDGDKNYSYVNSLLTDGETPQYALSLGISDGQGTWRDESKLGHGALIDINSNYPVLRTLSLPHSLSRINNEIYFCNSGHGEFCKWTPGDFNHEVVFKYDGFLRGVCQLDDTHVAIGVSQGRWNSGQNMNIDPLAAPGILIVDISTGTQVDFEPLDIKEIFDIVLISGDLND